MEYCQPLRTDALRRLQMVLLDMLIEIDRICRKHDIKYHITGGTLLGAVRHKGFIPWDDDIDVSMPRNEYEKFKGVCEKELDGKKYFLQDHLIDPHYRWGYAKLRRKNSELIRVGQEHMKMQTGIFIDIFIVDHVPDFYPLRLIHGLCCFILRKILYSRVGVVTGDHIFSKTIYKMLNVIPADYAFGLLEKLAEYWNKRQTTFERALTFPTPKFGSPTEWSTDLIDIMFEGSMFKAMRDYDAYLQSKYGDYMILPPENRRQWHPASVLILPDEYLSNR